MYNIKIGKSLECSRSHVFSHIITMYKLRINSNYMSEVALRTKKGIYQQRIVSVIRYITIYIKLNVNEPL